MRSSATRTRGMVVVGVVGFGLLSAVLWGRPLVVYAPYCLARAGQGCATTQVGVVFMTLLMLPVAALAVTVLALLRRTADGEPAWRRSLAEVGLIYGTVPFVCLTMLPGRDAGLAPGRVSLTPLADLATMGSFGIVGNLVLLAGLGFFGPIRFAALTSVPRVLLLGAACSILIETAQYTLQLDRVSSVDDVLLNAAGAGLAALASRPWWRALPARVPA